MQGNAVMENAHSSSGSETFIKIDGSKVANATDLMRAISEAMDFPDYFGWNWDALEECLSDLSWLSATAYIFRWDLASNLLINSPKDFFIALEIFASISQSWKDRGKRFQLFIADDYIYDCTETIRLISF